jgi:integrase
MSIEAIPPREGKTPYWYGRGTHIGTYVDRSTKSRKKRLALQVIAQWERDIERGQFAKPGDPTFGGAALAYLKKGGERRFLVPIIEHFQDTPLKQITQVELDTAAIALYPDALPATLNRNFYSPTIAVLHSAGVQTQFSRPEGAAGRELTGFLWPEKAQALISEACMLDLEFGIMLVMFYATGERLTAMLNSAIDNLRIDENYLFIPKTKNGKARGLYLPPFAVAALRRHPRGLDRPGQRIFKFHKGGHIYSLLHAAAAKAGVELPDRQAFHIFCHTYGTMMRRYGKLDLRGLVGTDRWSDIKSTMRYAHAVPSEDAQRAALLPPMKMPRRIRGKRA